jgi:hypothetical protein
MVGTISDATLFEEGIESREKNIACDVEFRGRDLNKKSEFDDSW